MHDVSACMCSCVCTCMCMHKSVHTCVCVEIREQPWMSFFSGTIHLIFSPLFLREGILLAWNSLGEAGWSPGIFLSLLPS